MKVLVVGATGGSGRAAVQSLLAGGHTVTAFARRADTLAPMGAGLRCVNGDVLKPADIEAAVEGQDAVIVTLGISESALRVRLAGSAGTAMNVRSAGTRNTIAAMRKWGCASWWCRPATVLAKHAPGSRCCTGWCSRCC